MRDEFKRAGEEGDGGPEGVLEGVATGEVGLGGEGDVGEEGEEVVGCFEFGWVWDGGG